MPTKSTLEAMERFSLISALAKYGAFVAVWLLVGCAPNEQADASDVYTTPWQSQTPAITALEDPAAAEEMTIAVPIEAHEVKIVRQKHEHQQVRLSEANVKELESWWDSLPEPVQSQIKANEIDIEVVSKIRTNDKKAVDPVLNDSQIEETGEALEQIIGTETGMTYTVSTTLVDEAAAKGQQAEETHETNIRLVKQVPVKLQDFKTDIFLREGEISNENIQTLQYWWSNLPLDVQNKIKSRQLVIDITYSTLAEIDGDLTQHHTMGENYTAVMQDLLERMVGVYTMNRREYALAQIHTHLKTEPVTAKTANLPARQYIRIGLRKNKQLSTKAPL